VSLFRDEKFAEMFEDLERVATGGSYPAASSRQEEELKNLVTGLQAAN
jgi:hypothetical protein